MSTEARPLEWSAQYHLIPSPPSLAGDKVILPSQALEQLLDAAPQTNTSLSSPQSYNGLSVAHPYASAAQRHAQHQFAPTEQKLPHPLTFRLVNPENSRVVYAGVAEFSAPESSVALSSFLLNALGLQDPKNAEDNASTVPEGDDNDLAASSKHPKITAHFQQLPKGEFVRLRPLEAGYDPEDWKALLETHMRSNFTTLTRGEVLTVRATAMETFQFLVDEFRPQAEGICVVDTDLEVDIEALNEEQARETMKKYAQKHKLVSDPEQGSSSGGDLNFGKKTSGQLLPGHYVDYELKSWPRHEGLTIDLETYSDVSDAQLDLFVSPHGHYQRARPREDQHVFADVEDRPSKRIRLSPANIELDKAESLYVAVHAPLVETTEQSKTRFSITVTAFQQESTPAAIQGESRKIRDCGPDEAICTNCKHAIPKQSLTLHESFCRRNNVRCPYSDDCEQVFQRGSTTVEEHWHCEACSSSGSSKLSRRHHQRRAHTPVRCPSCSYPDDLPSLSTLAQHRVTTCPGKQILCRFCHLTVPQGGSGDDPFATSDAEVVLSGMTAHEVADGARTTECHLCGRIVRLREMETHLKNHDFERRTSPDQQTTPLHFCTDESNQRRRGLADMLQAEGKRTPMSGEYGWPWCVAALEAQKGDVLQAHDWLKNFAPTLQEEA
ncbi:MAG: hypothetical protein Q9162_002527 [Coniocarpon cinnabarinum]